VVSINEFNENVLQVDGREIGLLNLNMVEDLDFDTLLFCEMVSFKVRKAFG
jgi:hypothetical protein